MKKHLIILLFCAAKFSAFSQSDYPVNVVSSTSDYSKPLILFITGDGGWNAFSSTLGKELAKNGYPVVALNAKKFFWKKKSAAETGAAIESLTSTYMHAWKRSEVILVGYSFGADVLPAGYNSLPAAVKNYVQRLVLLSPSGVTDFELHLSYVISGGKAKSILPALNVINGKTITIITGQDENDFPFGEMRVQYKTVKLAGGHHYDGDEEKVAAYILK